MVEVGKANQERRKNEYPAKNVYVYIFFSVYIFKAK